MMIKKKIILLIIIFSFLLIENKLLAENSNIYELEAEKVRYHDQESIIIAEGKALAKNNSGKRITANKIIYNKKKQTIKTIKNSKYIDEENTLYADSFFYNINSKIIEAKSNVIFIDKNKNKFYLDYLKYNQDNQIGYGKNVKSKFSDQSYFQSSNVEINNKTGKAYFSNGKYTTCQIINNKKNDFCPSWSLNSKQITHNKNEKKIIHKNAVLKLKQFPVFYTPYASHPDPSVKRQSGFLPPLIKTINNIGRTVKVPYFWVIDDDKDLTFTPSYYFDEHNLYQTSYRQAFKNSFLKIENGYSEGYKRFNKSNRSKGSRNYIFVDFKSEQDNFFLEKNEIEFKLQRVSQENFLRVNKINTNLFKEDLRNLENSFKISSYGERIGFELKTGVFENLDTNGSEKYTYYFPDGILSYNNRFLNNHNLNFNSYFQGKKFSKNQKQAKVRNLINLNRNPILFKKIGLSSTLKTSLLNNNIYNNNVTGQKGNSNIDNYLTIAFDNILPFGKFSKDKYQTISPKFFIKYTTGNMQNAFDNDKILNFSDVFSMNRTNDLDKPETGFSLGHGAEYSLKKYKKNTNDSLYTAKFGMGQVMRAKRENKMPYKSSLNNKESDLAGFMQINILGDTNNFANNDAVKNMSFLNIFNQNNLNLKYNFNIDNDLSKLIRNSFNISATYNKLFSELIFDEKNTHIGNERTGTINLKKIFKENYYLSLSAKKNLKTNASEFNRIAINFENDCLTTSLGISNDFYFDKDLSKSKMIVFSITIKPFSDSFAPDLTNLIK